MSDSRTRYCAIHQALTQQFPNSLTGNQARHRNTLAALISGIVGSQRCTLPQIASHLADNRQRESRVKTFTRFLANPRVTHEVFYDPFAKALLAHLPSLTLVMDATDIGRGCLALMVSVVFKKRALPLCWQVVTGKKGHLPETIHQSLLQEASRLVGTGGKASKQGKERPVVFLGDGEFDGCSLLADIAALGWQFVCRTAKNVLLKEALGETQEPFSFADLGVQPGECLEIEAVTFTGAGFGPVRVVALWEKGYREPLFLVTNLDLGWEACQLYKRRFTIETLFSDQKSRGFHLHKSHLSDPARLSRLLIAVCLAYLWLVWLGNRVRSNPVWRARVHRRSKRRCDLSLFSLGKAWVAECLAQEWRIPVAFIYAKE